MTEGHSAEKDAPEIAIRRAAMPLCQKRHPDLMLTGFFVDGEFVAACASCQAEVRASVIPPGKEVPECDHVAGYYTNPHSGATCWDCGAVVED